MECSLRFSIKKRTHPKGQLCKRDGAPCSSYFKHRVLLHVIRFGNTIAQTKIWKELPTFLPPTEWQIWTMNDDPPATVFGRCALCSPWKWNTLICSPVFVSCFCHLRGLDWFSLRLSLIFIILFHSKICFVHYYCTWIFDLCLCFVTSQLVWKQIMVQHGTYTHFYSKHMLLYVFKCVWRGSFTVNITWFTPTLTKIQVLTLTFYWNCSLFIHLSFVHLLSFLESDQMVCLSRVAQL